MKTLITSLLLLTLCAASASAAVIQFDTSLDNSGSPLTTNGTDTSYDLGSLTVANNTNRMLVIAIGVGGDSGGDSTDISGITFGTQDFTRQVSASQGGGRWANEIWTLASPDAGSSQDITLNLGTANDGQTLSFGAMSFYDVDLSDPFLDTVEQNTDADPVDLVYDFGADTVSPTYVEVASSNDAGGWGTVPTGLNTLVNEDNGELTVAIGYQSVTDETGSVTRSYEDGGPNNYSGSGIALKAVPEPSAGLLIVASLGIIALLRRRAR